jgi:hypothetical protein
VFCAMLPPHLTNARLPPTFSIVAVSALGG